MLISTTLKPNSKHREEVIDNGDGTLTIFTKAPATEGKANEAAVRLLAKYYRARRSQVHLVRGHTSRHKIFEIDKPRELTYDEIITIILPTINNG